MTTSKQEVFDKAYTGLHAQGFRQSIRPGTNDCAYRGANDCRCAVGHLIPDDLYDKQMDRDGGTSADKLLVNHPQLLPLFEGIELTFLQDLQHAHDTNASDTPVGMEDRLIALAQTHNLEVPQL